MSAYGCPAREFPFDSVSRLDVEPTFAVLRQQEPIGRVRLPYGGDAWLVTRYDDVKKVLGDQRFSRAATVHADVPRLRAGLFTEGALQSLDPPEHTRLRRTVAKVFTARRVEELRPDARTIAEGLLDRIADEGTPAELASSYALPLSITMICNILGVPYSDRDFFRECSDALLSTTAYTEEDMVGAVKSLDEYLAGLIEKQRREPTDDLLGALVWARDDHDGRLAEDELVAIARDILVAGHETTASQLVNFVYVLLEHPEEMAKLRENPEMVPSAVEELMRYVPLGPGGFRSRIATEEVQLGQVLIQPGEAVFAPTISANRDEQEFDCPTRLDVEREHNPQIAFGYGIHHCLGAQLARMELQVGVGMLIRRFPELRLAVPDSEIPWKSGLLVRGPRSLQVRW